MIPHDDFTPHGYLDNPYHAWKLTPSGVLRSQAPLGMGWHMPNLGSYARNQFQYTAHLSLGFKVANLVLITPDDFKRHDCTITSHLHTKNRFEYTCTIPQYALTLSARYFLIQEHTLGCILSLVTHTQQALPVTCYLIHQHTHNPHTSRLWEHGLYARSGPQSDTAMLGLASEGDVFVHGARSADGTELIFGEFGYMTSLQDAHDWVRGRVVTRPGVTQQQQDTGWQTRTLILPCSLTMNADTQERIINVVLARGVSQDVSYQRWEEGIEEIALAEANHRSDDEAFWGRAPQLAGDWPAHWRRGLIYDLETLRMVIRPPLGVFASPWDGMQIQAPRAVLAEAAMDALFLSYADPVLALEVMLGHFASAPHPQLPCMREDGSYNMVTDDGEICGTAPEWGFPVWCCDQLFRRVGDTSWLLRLYPKVAAYLRWWLAHRRDAEGWLVYICSWESGQDVSSRFGPQQTGGTTIEHVRPADLQASMAQAATIVAEWATILGQQANIDTAVDFTSEVSWWHNIANEFTVKTRLMWHDGWFRDYDAVTQEWSTQQDTMHLAPVFCDVAGWGQIEQLRPYFSRPPMHSGWEPLSWPPVIMTLVGAAAAAKLPAEAVELAYRHIDAVYRSTDRRDENGGLPGVTREYLGTITTGKWGKSDYANAGIEGYGWGAVSIHLLMRYIIGLREDEVGKITVLPMLPQALRKPGAVYTVESVQWGNYSLRMECAVQDAERYVVRISAKQRIEADPLAIIDGVDLDAPQPPINEQQWTWEGTWGDKHQLQLF